MAQETTPEPSGPLDLLGLADAMGAIGGLGLDRGIPPSIIMKHVVGRGEVQSKPAGFE